MKRILVIDRERWYRGRGSSRSRLLRSDDGKMCCLGFLCLSLGMLRGEIYEKEFPDSLQESLRNLFRQKTGMEYDDWRHIGDLNDARYSFAEIPVEEERRERALKVTFAQFGIDVRFSDKHIADAVRMRHERAYYNWINAGRPEGRSLEFWMEAEQFIQAP